MKLSLPFYNSLVKHKPEAPLSPGQVNGHGQVIDNQLLKKDRLKFSVAGILDHGEEGGLGGIPVVVTRMLGGDLFHIGVVNSWKYVGVMFQFLGVFLLQKLKSNRTAMQYSLYAGGIITGLLVAVLLSSNFNSLKEIALFLFMGLMILFGIQMGMQGTVMNNWLGDLVPGEKRGWFNSQNQIFCVFGILAATQIFGRIADRHPNSWGYSSIFLTFCVSFFIAVVVLGRATDRQPKCAGFFSTQKTEGINYRNPVMWHFVAFGCLWGPGRSPTNVFASVFLIDEFHWSLTNLAWLYGLQYTLSLVFLFIFGKIADRIGNRIPLMIISGIIASSQLLWISSVWFGVTSIIVAAIINSLGMNVHWMLYQNLMLEKYPAKGRAAYFSFARMISGTVSFLAPVTGGYLLTLWKDLHLPLFGVVFNNFHVIFFIGTILALLALIPLYRLKRYKAES